ncbi:MAG: hypothetical protein HYY62_08190 [Deltaproteobacteria bacterium]|nr:hypothetical protein [Deltaproteobacteria bacterium]
MKFLKDKSFLSLLLGIGILGSTSSLFAEMDFCEKLLSQLPGFNPFQDEATRDREELGMIAHEAGIRYFYLKVSIADLPKILEARYLPDFTSPSPRTASQAILSPVSTSFIGRPIDVILGGLNIQFEPMAPFPGEDPDRPTPLRPSPNHNALILYSPRVLSLLNWYFGGKPIFKKDPAQTVITHLHRGASLLSSSNSRSLLAEDFNSLRTMQEEGDHFSHPVLQIEGALPSYEIVGIVAQPENKRMVEAILSRSPLDLSAWNPRISYSHELPDIDPVQVPYLPEHLRAVAEDISPIIRSNYGRGDNVILDSAVFDYSSNFVTKVQTAVPQMLGAIHPIDPDNPTGGISAHESRNFDQLETALSKGGTFDGVKLPKLLPGAEISGYGYFTIQAIKEWRFFLVEFQNPKGEKCIALLIRNGGKKEPPSGVPHLLWGIASVDQDAQNISWIWTP